MSNTRLVAYIAIVLCVALAAGCEDTPEDSAGTATIASQMTPRETMKKLMVSLEKADVEGYLACFDANDAEKKELTAIMELVVSKSALEETCRKTFGDEAYGRMDLGESAATPLTDQELDLFQIEITGTRALAVHEQESKNLVFVLKDGAWKLSAAAFVPDPMQSAKEVAILDARSKISREVAEAAKKPGATAEGIEKMLNDKLDALRMAEAETVK